MKPITKKTIKISLISGLSYACLNTGIDYLREMEISWSKFVISGLVFGLFSAILTWYNHRKIDSQ